MKTLRKALFIILSVMMVLSSSVYAFSQNDVAQEINTEKKTFSYINTMTEAEKEAERYRQLQEQLNKLKSKDGENIVVKSIDGKNIIIMNDPNDYKTEWGTSKTVYGKGYAGNQPSWSIFPSGGGFWFSDSGGPTVSVSASFPEPFSFVSFSISLGNSGTSGKFVNAPSPTTYYKLYIEKGYEVTPYIIYKKIWDDFEGYIWVEYSGGYSKIWLTTSQYAKAK